jgi:hypothetical protein
VPSQTSTDLLVLHTLRCIGFAGLPRVAAAAGLEESDTESHLIDLAVAGEVTHLKGEFGGWGLTDAGRAADAERIAAELEAAGARDLAQRAYDAFMVLNPELLDLCSAWQLRPSSDRGHEQRVLDRLAVVDRRAEAALAALCAALPRFRRYRERLADALTQARSGETRYVTDDMESYHSVWFQLHEDLLTTLGMPRT